jgi:hypothetical protein
LLQFYFQGLATLEELSLGLEREAALAAARAARQKKSPPVLRAAPLFGAPPGPRRLQTAPGRRRF